MPGLASPRGFGDPDLTKVEHAAPPAPGRLRRPPDRPLIEQMERAGIWKRALVVVTADHGYAFEVGVETRRRTNDSNIDMIAPVPLFIKAPGQRRGPHRPLLRAHGRHRPDDRRHPQHLPRLRRRWPLRLLARPSGGGATCAWSSATSAARSASPRARSSAGGGPSSAASCGCSASARRAARTGACTAASGPTASCSAGRCPSSPPPRAAGTSAPAGERERAGQRRPGV